MPPAMETEKTKRLRGSIGQYKAQITRARQFAKEQNDQVLVDIEGIKLRMEQLKQGFKSYQSLSLDLALLTEEPPDDEEVESKYFSVMSQLKSTLSSCTDGQANESSKKNESSQHSRLPQLDIACFDGKEITDYKPFIDLFKAIVGSDTSLTPVQKLFYLKRYLKGDALLLIDGLSLVNESYEQAVNLLDGRYNNKCLVITHHINKLLDYQPISKGTSVELRHLVSVVRQQVGALNNLGQKTEHWDMLLISLVLRKLDSLSSRIYYSERDVSKLPTFEDLLCFIERRAMSFEESSISAGRCVSHSITWLDAPRYVDPRRDAELRCGYARQPRDPPLHSVKWYLAAHEIFRYTPQEYESRAFNSSGVSITNSSCDLTSCNITVRPERGTARYTCEVSSEGPRFAVDRRSANMTLAVLPEYDPLITGLPTLVAAGEQALVNCTADYSLPAARLDWFVDNEPQEDPVITEETHVSGADSEGLRASWRTLHVFPDDYPTHRGYLSLRCRATVHTHPPLVRAMSVRLYVAGRPHISSYMFSKNNGVASSDASRRSVEMTWTLLLLLTSAFIS